MTATINRRGQVVLQTATRQKSPFKTGDILVVTCDHAGQLVLQKHPGSGPKSVTDRSYLTPAPISRTVLNRIYARSNPEQDKLEEEAAALSRQALRRMWKQEVI